MSNRLALIGLMLLLVGLLALIVTGMVREVAVIPLLYLLWLTRVLFRASRRWSGGLDSWRSPRSSPGGAWLAHGQRHQPASRRH